MVNIKASKKTNIKNSAKWIFLALTLLSVTFIFSQSLMSASDSSQESGAVLTFIMNIVSRMGLKAVLTQHIIRKLAHFTEFCIFGIFLTLTVISFFGSLSGKRFMVLFFSLAVPVSDETLQYFSQGRSAEVKDVLIDFSGALAGFLTVSLVFLIVSLRKTKNTAEES